MKNVKKKISLVLVCFMIVAGTMPVYGMEMTAEEVKKVKLEEKVKTEEKVKEATAKPMKRGSEPAETDLANIYVGGEVAEYKDALKYTNTAEGLLHAIADVEEGGNIHLLKDVEAEKTILMRGGNKSFSVLGNGHSINAGFKSTKADYKKNRHKQGLIAVEVYNGKVTFKDVTLNCDNKVGYGVKLFRVGDNFQYPDGQVVLDGVKIKSPIRISTGWFSGYGGMAIQINTSNCKLINPEFIDIPILSIDFDIGGGLPKTSKGRLEIVGISKYDTRYNIETNSSKQDQLEVIDNGFVFNSNKQMEKVIKVIGHDKYPISTLETYQYEIKNVWGRNLFTKKSVKIKGNDFHVRENNKYDYELEGSGKLDKKNVPSYEIKVISKGKETKYILKGTIKIKNFRPEDVENVKVEFTADVLGDKKNFLKIIDLKKDEEKTFDIDFEITKEQADDFLNNNKDVKVKLEGNTNGDRLLRPKTKDGLVVKDIDKNIEVKNDGKIFAPSFNVGYDESKEVVKNFVGKAIKKETTSKSYIELSDGSKKEVVLTLVPKKLKKKKKKGGSSSKTPKKVIEPEKKKEKNNYPRLNTIDHLRYVQGYTDNFVRPNQYITREEVAAIFFRLLEDEYREEIRTSENNLQDVNADNWSNKHISTLQKGKIIKGYEDNTFRPSNFMTRAEIVTLISKFSKVEDLEDCPFTDIKGHWAEKFIKSALKKGYIKGYKDNTFRPQNFITRAEIVEMTNNLLGRKVREDGILDGTIEFKDLQDKNKWYYYPMKIATNSYEYKQLEDGYQKWTKLIKSEKEM